MIIYLVGPSGSGKTTLAKALAAEEKESYRYIDLDTLIQERDPALAFHGGDRWPEYWKLAKDICLKIKNQDDNEDAKASDIWTYLLDIGAGALEIDRQAAYAPALAFFQSCLDMLTVIRTPAECFEAVLQRKRTPWLGRPLSEFEDAEFAPFREKIYEIGHVCDNRGHSEQESYSKFKALIDSLPRAKVRNRT